MGRESKSRLRVIEISQISLSETRHDAGTVNVGALIIRIGFWGFLTPQPYSNY